MPEAHDPRFDQIRDVGGDRYRCFLDAGYREWFSPGGLHQTPYLLQKAIRGDSGKRLYFVNVWAFDWMKFADWHPVRFSVSADVQFNTHSGQPQTFDVTLHDAGQPPAEIEAFFAAMYERMECQPYDED